MILIISTPDASCKHFISHGLSVEPWSFYSCTYKCLTLEMSLRRNLTPQRRSLIKLLLLFVLPARLSSSVLSFWDFFFKVYPNNFYICKSNDLENSASRQRPSLPTWACRSPGRGALWRGACAAVPGRL